MEYNQEERDTPRSLSLAAHLVPDPPLEADQLHRRQPQPPRVGVLLELQKVLPPRLMCTPRLVLHRV